MSEIIFENIYGVDYPNNMIIAGIIILLACYLIYFRIRIQLFHAKHGRGLVTPEMYPIVGNVHLLLKQSKYIQKLNNKYFNLSI